MKLSEEQFEVLERLIIATVHQTITNHIADIADWEVREQADEHTGHVRSLAQELLVEKL